MDVLQLGAMEGEPENILVSALDERWDQTRAQLKRCRAAFSVEAVHDLRVATRRLLAVFEILNGLESHARVRKVRRVMKKQLDDLDNLRDVQVMLAETASNIEWMPELIPFQTYLHKRERHMLRVARKDIQVYKPSEMSKRIEKIQASLKKPPTDPEFSSRMLEVVDTVYLGIVQAYGQIDAAKPATIHRLRIAFKKYRYMTEIVLPFLPDFPVSQLEQMHGYQTAMGAVHDVETLLNALEEFAEKKPLAINLDPIRQHYEKCLAENVSAYFENRAELFTFWRAGSDQPFPWEMIHDPLRYPSRNRRSNGKFNNIRKPTRRQPAPADHGGSQEDAADRAGAQGAASADRPDPEQPLQAGDADGPNLGEDV